VDSEIIRSRNATNASPKSTLQSRLANPRIKVVGVEEESDIVVAEVAKAEEMPILQMPTQTPAMIPHTVRYLADSCSI
jgi:hypothetical protein